MNKILVIEDEPNINSSICDLLELEDYEAIPALNGKQGIVLAIQEQPDLILCDIMMPEMTGLEVIETLRKTKLFEDTPFIFLSALSDRGDIRKGMNLGADDYIPKPFEPDDVLTAIEKQINRLESRREERKQLKSQLKNQEAALRQHSFLNSHKLRGPISNLLGLLQLSDEIASEELLELLKVEAKKIDQIVSEINSNLNMKNMARENTALVYLIDDDQLQHKINNVVIRKVAPDTEIRGFFNGFEAIAEMKMSDNATLPDVIILDLNMPVMNGYEFLEAFSKMELSKGIDIYVLSSSIDKDDVEKCMTYDAVKGYLTKPLRRDQIASALNAS